MLVAFQVITVLVVAVAMALALAHALEWPGKLRLSQHQYVAMQAIYYPGFTIGGAAEPVGILMLAALMLMFPLGGPAFWLTAAALTCLIAMQAIFWGLTQPVNRYWVKDLELEKAGSRFFAVDPFRLSSAQPDWTYLRDRWEFSHVLRAVFGVASLILLVTAIAIT